MPARDCDSQHRRRALEPLSAQGRREGDARGTRERSLRNDKPTIRRRRTRQPLGEDGAAKRGKIMTLVLALALWVSLASALRVPPQSEWAALVADIERQHALVPFVQTFGQNDTWFSASNPPSAPDSLEVVGKHVPQMWQRSDTQVNIRVSHEMNWNPENGQDLHYIHAVFIRNNATMDIVFVGILEPGDTSVDVDASVFGGLGGKGFLVPYEFCNIHGLWQGDALQTFDAASWNLIAESLRLFDKVEEECQGNIYLLDDTHSLQLSLINRKGEVVVDVADATSLQVTFVFPRGHFLGLGFGDSMLGTDMIIAAERDGTALCADFHTSGSTSRSSGPDIDAQQDVQVVSVTLEDKLVTLVCTKSLYSSDPDDKAVLNQRENLIWSFQEVDGEPSTTSNAFLKRHAATNRGYILDADLGGSGGELAIANSRDKRDLQVAHGMLMYMIWGINICVGAMIARYAHDRAWGIGAHRIIQGINTMLTMPGYYLSQRFVDVHFLSAHAIIGTILVYSSILQAGLGTIAYLCSKYSKKVAKEFLQSEMLSQENKDFIAKIEAEHGQRELLHEIYHKLDTLSTPRAFEITAFIEKTVNRGIPSCVPPGIAIYVLTRLRQTVIRPIHRIVGRIMPVFAYAQIYLGLDRLQANTVIIAIINMWTILVAIILIYKESERQFGLPHGILSKLLYFKRLIRSLLCRQKKHDGKRDSFSGSDQARANVNSGDLERASIQETGRSIAGEDSVRHSYPASRDSQVAFPRRHSSPHEVSSQVRRPHGKLSVQTFPSTGSEESSSFVPSAPCSTPRAGSEHLVLDRIPTELSLTKASHAELDHDETEVEMSTPKLPPRITFTTMIATGASSSVYAEDAQPGHADVDNAETVPSFSHTSHPELDNDIEDIDMPPPELPPRKRVYSKELSSPGAEASADGEDSAPSTDQRAKEAKDDANSASGTLKTDSLSST